MQIYNTATRRKEELVTHEPGKVAMYACGPTVYNYIHIGNARTFLIFDMVRKYLKYRGYEVAFVQNITDVDDKIIRRAQEEGKTPEEVAAFYTKAFIDNMHTFGIDDPDVRPRATQEIPEYGELSGRNVDDLQSGARVDVDERKRDPLDFALWKAAKPGEPHWSSPWGEGRPGWHLECSAMSQKYLGVPLDVHGGGSDLVFPHHENEKAQTEAAYDEDFVRYWMHSGMLRINSEKMSKSLGNFLLLKDVLETCNPSALRLLMLQTHYRSPLDFSDARLAEADTSYGHLCTTVRNLRWAAEHAAEDAEGNPSELDQAREAMRTGFVEAMDDDFNTAGGLAAIFSFANECNRFLESHDRMNAADREAALLSADAIEELMGVLGIAMPASGDADEWPVEVCDLAARTCNYAGDDPHAAADALLEARAQARAEKNWALADAVRDGLAALGFTIEDTPNGARVSYGE